MPPPRASRAACSPSRVINRGFTLLEIVIVVALLALIAAVARPDASAFSAERLDAAASEVVDALRYARVEAMRTEIPHGVRLSNLPVARVRVFRYDPSSPTPAEQYDVIHPIDRQLYDVIFGNATTTASVAVQSALFYSGTTAFPDAVVFDALGAPVLYAGSTPNPYTSGSVILMQSGYVRTVVLDAVTGRARKQ